MAESEFLVESKAYFSFVNRTISLLRFVKLFATI